MLIIIKDLAAFERDLRQHSEFTQKTSEPFTEAQKQELARTIAHSYRRKIGFRPEREAPEASLPIGSALSYDIATPTDE